MSFDSETRCQKHVELVEPVGDRCELLEIGRAIRNAAHQSRRQIHHLMSEGRTALRLYADDLLDGVEGKSVDQPSKFFVKEV